MCVRVFRYEVPEFQQQVMKVFQRLKDDGYWKEINADQSFESLQSELLTNSLQTINEASTKDLGTLW